MPVYKDPNKKTKDGRMWYFVVNYTTTQGIHKKYVSKFFLTKKEASEEEAKYLLKVNKIKDIEEITISQVIEEMLEEKQQTIKYQSYLAAKNIFKHIDNQLGTIKLSKFTPAQYEEFRRWLFSNDWSVGHKNAINKSFKELIKYANRKHKYNITFPMDYDSFVDKDKKIEKLEFYTHDQFLKYIDAIPQEDFIYKAFFDTLGKTGLRLGECNGLHFNNVDFDKKTISVERTVTTKIKSNTEQPFLISSPKSKTSIRTIPVMDSVLETIKTLRSHYERYYGFNDDWYIFGGHRPLPESTLGGKNNTYAKLAGLPKIKIHGFRHTFASYMIHLNCSVATLSKYLGHSDISITLRIYSHYYESDMFNLVKIANNSFNS